MSHYAQAKSAFNELGNVLRNKNMSMNIRLRVLKCYVWSVFLYGCESWTMTKTLREKVEAFEMWCLRKMQRISYTSHTTNEKVLRQTSRNRQLFKIIVERQLGFFGHIVRKGKGEFLAISGNMEGVNKGKL